MWVLIMLVVAVAAGAGAYWISLATLPDDDELGESGIRAGAGEAWRRLLHRGRRASTRVRGSAKRLRPLGARVRASAVQLGLAGDPFPPSPPRGDAVHGRRDASSIGPAASTPTAPASTGLGSTVAGAATAAQPRTHVAPPAPAPPPPSVALNPPQRAARPDGLAPAVPDPTEAEGVLFVPVVRDAPDAHSRLVAFLGIVVLVTIAGGLLALGVWQSVHFIARALQNIAG